MIGRNAIQDGGILAQPLDARSAALYSRQMSIPWSVGWGAAGIQASPASYGRGLKSSANKISEHNIYNTYPRLFAQNQLPPQTRPPQTRKVLSRVIPSIGVTGR